MTSKRVCAGGRGSRRAKISKKRGTAPKPATTISWRATIAAEARRFGSMVRLVVESTTALIFNQGLLQQCVDAVALPIHFAVLSTTPIKLSS